VYDAHVPVISAAIYEDAETFKRAVTFVILSIRQPIENVPAMLADVDETRAESIYLLGHKRAAYRYIELHGRELWARVRDLTDPEAVILELLSVPGLGIVKAGFLAQLMGLDVACLDSRNVAREGRKPREYRTDGKGAECRAIRRKVSRYVAETGGRAREYWNAWCEDVAQTRNNTAQTISEIHLTIVPETFIPF